MNIVLAASIACKTQGFLRGGAILVASNEAQQPNAGNKVSQQQPDKVPVLPQHAPRSAWPPNEAAGPGCAGWQMHCPAKCPAWSDTKLHKLLPQTYYAACD